VSQTPEQLAFFTVRVPRVTVNLSAEFYGAEDLLAEGALRFFEQIREEVREAVFERMRDGGEHSGEKERDNLKALTIGGDAPALRVYGDLVQTLVDEFGLQPERAFPPWRAGSPLFEWTLRHGLGQDTSKGEARFLTPREARAAGQLLGGGTAKSHREAVERQIESVAFLIARAIYRRGLPRPDDFLHEPFEETFNEFLPRVLDGLAAVESQVADAINGVGVY
jgi:hypothetical protein